MALLKDDDLGGALEGCKVGGKNQTLEQNLAGSSPAQVPVQCSCIAPVQLCDASVAEFLLLAAARE